MANETSQAARAQTEITDELVDEIAAEASVCKPTVYKRLAGLPVRGRAGARVDRVIAMKRGRSG